MPGIALGSGDKSTKEKGQTALVNKCSENQCPRGGGGDGVGWGGTCCEGKAGMERGEGRGSSVLAILGTWRRPGCRSSFEQGCGEGSLTL